MDEGPQRHSGVEGFPALQEFLSDSFMAGPPLAQEGPRDSQSLFGIIGGLADAPFIPFPGITGNDISRLAMESGNPARVPTLHIRSGKRLRLLANGIAGRQSLETADYAFR